MNAASEMRSLMSAGVHFNPIPSEDLFREWAAQQGNPDRFRPSEKPAYKVFMV